MKSKSPIVIGAAVLAFLLSVAIIRKASSPGASGNTADRVNLPPKAPTLASGDTLYDDQNEIELKPPISSDLEEQEAAALLEGLESGYGSNHPAIRAARQALLDGSLEDNLLTVVDLLDTVEDPALKRNAAATLFAQLAVEFPPKDLLEALETLVPDIDTESVTKNVVQIWAGQYPSAAAGWFLERQALPADLEETVLTTRNFQSRAILEQLYKEFPDDAIAFWTALDSESAKRNAIRGLMDSGDDLASLTDRITLSMLTPSDLEIVFSEIAAADARRAAAEAAKH